MELSDIEYKILKLYKIYDWSFLKGTKNKRLPNITNHVWRINKGTLRIEIYDYWYFKLNKWVKRLESTNERISELEDKAKEITQKAA